MELAAKRLDADLDELADDDRKKRVQKLRDLEDGTLNRQYKMLTDEIATLGK